MIRPIRVYAIGLIGQVIIGGCDDIGVFLIQLFQEKPCGAFFTRLSGSILTGGFNEIIQFDIRFIFVFYNHSARNPHKIREVEKRNIMAGLFKILFFNHCQF